MALEEDISPKTASMSACEVTIIQARPLQIVPKVFSNGLQCQHQAGIAANKLPHFIDQEQHALLGSFAVQVFFHPLTEVFDRNTKGLLRILKPFMRSFC